MYEWPILLGLSLGKSIYSDYRPSSCISLVLVLLSRLRGWFTTGIGLIFAPHPLPSANLHERIRGTKISFSVPRVKMVSFEAARQRKWKERFLHCRFLSLWLLIIHCADSVVPSFLTYEMRKALWVTKAEGKFRFLYIIDIFLNAFRKQDNGHTNTSKRIIRNIIINNIYNII